jgi:DME family drug/metabolite transporter
VLVSDLPVAAARRSVSGLWFLVLAGCLWGTGGLTGSVLAHSAGLGPLAVAAYRLGIGGAALLAVLAVTRRSFPRGRAAWTRVVALGLLAALFQSSYFAAVDRTGISLATLVAIGAAPVLVLLAEALSGRRRVLGVNVVAAVLAVSGLALLIGVPQAGRDLAGAGLALLAAAGFATMTFIGARPVAGLDDLASTGAAFTLGAVVLVPLALAGGGLGFTPRPGDIGLLLLLGLGPTALGYAAYFRGLRTTPAGTAALLALLEPLVGTALAYAVLGDRLGPAGLTGAAILVAALILESVTARK